MDGNLWRENVRTFKEPAQTGFLNSDKAIKRGADILIATLALLVLSPLLFVVALAIKLDSPGPVFFCQRRGGIGGRPFAILKFRTLTVLEDGPAIRQISRGDSRVTRVGRFLRRTSLDELPQLVNVLTGDMALVGPRPHALAHDEMYGRTVPDYSLRFAVRPGITGWAQVNGARGPTPMPSDMKRRLDFDVWYIEHRTLGLDVRILAVTVFAVLSGRMDSY